MQFFVFFCITFHLFPPASTGLLGMLSPKLPSCGYALSASVHACACLYACVQDKRSHTPVRLKRGMSHH